SRRVVEAPTQRSQRQVPEAVAQIMRCLALKPSAGPTRPVTGAERSVMSEGDALDRCRLPSDRARLELVCAVPADVRLERSDLGGALASICAPRPANVVCRRCHLYPSSVVFFEACASADAQSWIRRKRLE